MSSRNLLVIILTVSVVLVVMATALWITFGDSAASQADLTVAETWKADAPTVSSLKITNLTGKGKSDLSVQAERSFLIFDASGKKTFERSFSGILAAATADVNGDGISEALTCSVEKDGVWAEAFRAEEKGVAVWRTRLSGLGTPSRLAAIDFNGKGLYGLAAGDIDGRVAAISEQGQELWRYQLGTGSPLRGLDTVYTPAGQLLAVADEAGHVRVLDRKGSVAWSYNLTGGLRRLRSEEILGASRSAVLLGGEGGELIALNGATGELIWQASLGQPVTEIRPVELDGDPATRELVAGGKLNGVWGYTQDGKQLFAARIGGSKSKVTDIAGLNTGSSSRDLVVIGDDGGMVTFFSAAGGLLGTRALQAPINRFGSAMLNGQLVLLAADAAQIHGLQLTLSRSYLPLFIGLLVSLVLAGGAYAILSIRPAPPVVINAEQMSVEAQQARRMMLHEAINDLKGLQAKEQIEPEAYLERLENLRSQLAEVTANLIKLGAPVKAETFACPHCGGTLELGADRCEYCQQIVII